MAEELRNTVLVCTYILTCAGTAKVFSANVSLTMPASKERSLNVWGAASRGDDVLISSWCAHLRSLCCGGIRHTMTRAGGLPRRREIVRAKVKAGGWQRVACGRAGDVVSATDFQGVWIVTTCGQDGHRSCCCCERS